MGTKREDEERYNHNEIAVDKSISSAIFIAFNNG